MKGNYVVAPLPTQEGQHLIFGKVLEIDGNILVVRQEKDFHINPVHHRVFKERAMDLGPKPLPGKVHGFSTTKLYRGKTPQPLGDFHWFYKPSDKKLPALMAKAVKDLITVCEKLKLPVPPEDGLVWEVHPGGRMAGWYHHSRNPEKLPHRIGFSPDGFGDNSPLYIFAHEYAHWLYFNHVADLSVLVSSWLKAFNRSVKPGAPPIDAKDLLTDWFDSGLEPLQFRKSLEKDQRKCFDKVVNLIRKDFRVDSHDLTMLFLAGKRKYIKKLWEASSYTATPDVRSIITDYATFNVKELFAESFAHKMSGMKIADSEIQDLVSQTILTVRS